jgi:hypothetical protein
MKNSEQNVLIELIASMQVHAAMFHSLLEILRHTGAFKQADEANLFDKAQRRIDLIPSNDARRFAESILSAWRREGLI